MSDAERLGRNHILDIFFYIKFREYIESNRNEFKELGFGRVKKRIYIKCKKQTIKVHENFH